MTITLFNIIMILYFIRDHNNIFVISFCNIKNIDIMEWWK